MTIVLLLDGHRFGQGNKGVMEGVNIHCFIGQFPVAVFIIIVDIVAPVVHAQEIHHTDMTIPLLMLQVMRYQVW